MADRRPGYDWTSHRRAAEDEDIAFLVGAGSTLEEACARVGVAPETYHQRHRRHEDDR